jgi:HlyD family secretion protein
MGAIAAGSRRARPAGWLALICLLTTTVDAQEVRSASSRAPKKGEVTSAVPGPTTLLSIKAAGSRVEKGDLICELESFALKERLAEQEPATLAAEAALTVARRDRERAEQAVVSYTEGTYPQEIQTLAGRIALAASELKRAELRLETTRKGVERGLVPRNKQVADEVALKRARFNLENLERKKTTLESFTRDKTIKILQGAVEKARAEELIREASLERERDLRDRLVKQIADCRVFAPATGRLRYGPPIEPGVEINEGQLLFRVIPEENPPPKSAARPSRS